MNNKILISVKVPMIEQKYDIFVPAFKTIFNVIETIEQGISELSHGEYIPSGKVMLYNSNGELINPNVIVKESGLLNGSDVIMI